MINVKIEATARAIFAYNSMNSWDDGDAHSAREHYRNLARAALAAAETIAPMPGPAEGHISEWIEQCARIAEAQPYYPDTNVGMRQQWVKDQIAAKIKDLFVALPTEEAGK